MKKVNAVRPKNENNFLNLLLSLKLAEYKIAAESFSEIVFFLVQYSFLFEDTEKVLNSCGTEQSQLYALQENRDLGARYLDPKYSRWISADPALGEYIPQAPISDEVKKHNQNLPGMGGVFNSVNLNLYHYAANNPVKYFDPDGRETYNFNQKEYIKQQLYAQACAIDAGFRDFFGKIGNSVINIFTGNASYQVYAKASLNILNVDCNIFDLQIGSKGQDLSFTLEQKYADKFLEQFEKLIDAPITLTTSKLKVKAGAVSFTLQTDGTNLKVNVNLGKSKSIDFGALGEGALNICAGINISTNMDDGPCGTIKNGQSPAIEHDKAAYQYYTDPARMMELVEEY